MYYYKILKDGKEVDRSITFAGRMVALKDWLKGKSIQHEEIKINEDGLYCTKTSDGYFEIVELG